jgi:hypothetical protein
MSRVDLKTSRTGSRTPFQLLAAYYQTGDTRDRYLWGEYMRITSGLAAVRWSRGLRAAIFGAALKPERSDEEHAASDADGELVAVVPSPVWGDIRRRGFEHVVLVAAENQSIESILNSIASVLPTTNVF